MDIRMLTESHDAFPNPERGFYTGINLLGSQGDADRIRAAGFSLAYAQVMLDAYRDSDLPGTLLAGLRTGLGYVRKAGLKVVVRFQYDKRGGPDASLSRILGHINQLAPVLASGADVIAVLQAGFIGRWGEWHGSTHGLDNDAARAAVVSALLDALPATRSIQIRRPAFKRALQLLPAQLARIGHHNDGFLSSADDLGTYRDPGDEAYVANDGWTPVGGETAKMNPPRSDCQSALVELAQLRWSYLNAVYHPDVLAIWKAIGCWPEIERRLGYRLAVRWVSWGRASPGEILDVVVALRNVGFAAPFNTRPVFLVLRGAGGAHVGQLAEIDVRTWAPGKEFNITPRLRLPDKLPPGMYQLALWLPDEAAGLRADPRYSIRCANAGTWDGVHGENVLAQVLVEPVVALG